MDIPKTPADIHIDWLNQALAPLIKASATQLVRATAEVAATQGMTSTLVKLKLEWSVTSTQLPTRLVAKIRPRSDAVFARYLRLGFYAREVGFYRDIKDPGVGVPKCYLALQSESGDFVLLLEDLGTMNAKADSLTVVTTALRQVAGLHAKWWGGGDVKHLSWCNSDSVRRMRLARAELLEQHLAYFSSGVGASLLPPHMLAFLRAWVLHYPALADFRPHMPLTLVHGDFWPAQFFADNNSDAVYLLDWQSVHLNTPAMDVARLMCDALARGASIEIEGALIDDYLDRLGELRAESAYSAGALPLRRADFFTDYALELPGVLDLWMSHTCGLDASKTAYMRPFFQALTAAFERHQVFAAVQNHLGWTP